ncbi:hypothetical protein BCR36DRAFT_414396 [Piromyces finnis]|uniref:EGF-like domain-containing protein n=1 Tax=Piromyces finnis TaxID=1754191 RepID=A0A1Y1V3W3_9FUNG|nr:hypothetical protein BCR36DRAFT_414396 [Piromyces finnis]|eukprot:ORX45799.1 hypothetical protein BCR36DRAFT_414396 [Piromyces finnis]
MFLKIQYKIIFLLLQSIILWRICISIDVSIPNEKYNFDNINDLISSYSEKYKTINIYINQDYYTPDVSLITKQLLVPSNTNITLIGNPNNKNGTMFDFSNNKFCFYSFIFEEYTGQQFKFENITFTNYIDVNKSENSLFHTRSLYSTNFSIIFKNCVFDTGNASILLLEIQINIKNNLNEYQFLFDSCRFNNFNGNNLFVLKKPEKSYYYVNHYGIKIINSEFNNCSDLFLCYFGNIMIDNCKFIDISSMSKNAAFIELFFYNITMKNIQDGIGYIIKDIGQNSKINVINITDSYFENISSLVYGENINTFISNSVFYNISGKSSFPTIATSKYRNTTISNCKFKDIKLYGTSLFDIESSLYMDDSIFENISTYYKPIFQISYKDILFKNIDMKNINIYCDVNECNLFSIEMGEFVFNKKKIIFNNVNITNIQSNSNIFQFSGNSLHMEFDNLKIENSVSYGSLLKYISKNTKIYFRNSKIYNSRNYNKFDNGLVIIKNNIDVEIINSEFINNESYSSGILFFDEIENFNIIIKNSKFNKNHCYNNGGVINLIDNINSPKDYTKLIDIDNSIFDNNKANYFGGLLYANVYYPFKLNMTNSRISNNHAGVAGGFIFFEQINNRIKDISLFVKDKKYNNTIQNNTATSHGDEFATHPSKFILSDNDNTEIYSGGFISLTLELQDDFGNRVNDSEKIYSDIGVQTELYDTQNEKVKDYFISNIDNIFYNDKPEIYYILFKSQINYFDFSKTISTGFKIKINDCEPDKSYKLYKIRELFYCEDPICDRKCDVKNKYFKCVKGNSNNNNTENINNPLYNTCSCITGRAGSDCQQKVFYDTKNFESGVLVTTIIIEIIMTLIFIITFAFFRNYKVIKDFGKSSLIFITIGCILKIFNNLFLISDKKMNCSLNMITSYIGFALVYIAFIKKIIISLNFSIKFNLSIEDNIIMSNVFTYELYEKLFKETRELSNSIFNIGNTKKYVNKFYISSRNFDNQVDGTMSFHILNNNEQNPIRTTFSSLFNMQSQKSIMTYKRSNTYNGTLFKIYARIVMILMLIALFLVLCIIYIFFYSINDLKIIELKSGMYAYRCSNPIFSLIIYLAEFVSLLYAIIKYSSVRKTRYIFIDVYIIGIIIPIWIIFDPTINIIVHNLFKNNIIISHNIQFLCNSNEGNNRTFYFISVPKVKCNDHNSYSCECETKKIVKYTDEEIQSINEFILNYKKLFNMKYIFKNYKKISQ